jgi:hypothetical protein
MVIGAEKETQHYGNWRLKKTLGLMLSLRHTISALHNAESRALSSLNLA